MGAKTWDGTPIQPGLRTRDYSLTGHRSHYSIYGQREMVIVARYFIDDDNNRSKRYVEYTVRDVYTGESYPGARQLSSMGSLDDGDDFTLKPAGTLVPGATGSTSGAVNDQTPANLVDGDQVLVTFIEGSRSRPVIVGIFRHNSSQYGATKADGERRLTTHKGTTIEIKQDGEYIITHKSKSTVTLKTNGDVVVTPASGQKVFVGDDGASENWVLGQQWKTMMTNLINALLTATYPTGVGPTGPMMPPSSVVLTQIMNTLDLILSDMAFSQKVKT